jgi:predicted Rossmann fold nucleotide-binding protein DprA/Smf involved in DNA uptake
VLGFDPVGLDALVARTGMDAATLQAHLLELELEGHVAGCPAACSSAARRPDTACLARGFLC